jgi:glutaredoxin-like protein NrdH
MTTVQLYTLSTCHWCKKVKQLLAERNIPCELFEVDRAQGEEQKRMLAAVDQLSPKRSFPITVINGSVILGYKPEEIEEALPLGR